MGYMHVPTDRGTAVLLEEVARRHRREMRAQAGLLLERAVAREAKRLGLTLAADGEAVAPRLVPVLTATREPADALA